MDVRPSRIAVPDKATSCDPAAHLSTHAVAPRGALASLPPPHATQPEAAWILPAAHGAQ